jgi:hypothetical protein
MESLPRILAQGSGWIPSTHKLKKKKKKGRVLVALICNHSYLGDRDQEHGGSKSAQANSP